MAEDFDEEEQPRGKRKKGKGVFSRKRVALLAAVLLIFAFGAAFQHYLLEPVIGSGIGEKYALCLSQRNVLDERFAFCTQQLNDANNAKNSCEFRLSQCIETLP